MSLRADFQFASDEEDSDTSSLFTRPHRPPHARQTSIVSLHTAHEMYDIADLLGTSIDAPLDRPQHIRAQSIYIEDTIIDPSIHSVTSDDETDIDKSQGSLLSSSRSRISYSSSYSTPPSEYELVSSDGEIERVYLPPSPIYPGFHLPRSRNDAPSLISSRSHSSYSSSSSHLLPPTPGLVSPADEAYALPVITESENQEWERFSISSEDLCISPPDALVDAWPRKPSNLQWILTNSPQDDEIVEEPIQPDSPGLLSPSVSDSLASPMSPLSPKTPATPLSPTKISSFARFMKKDKGSRTSVSSAFSQLPLDSKAMKAEEKRLRKEEAKARTERLAEQLKARAKEPTRSIGDSSSISTERNKKEPHAMYGGLAGIVM